MIDISKISNVTPKFEKLCSIQKLYTLVEELSHDDRFRVQIVGESEASIPLHHIQFGHGSVKALFVGFPHCDEPVGGMTVFSLLTLLKENCEELIRQDIEWHFIPCVDPDGAKLNEGWSQQAFTLKNFMKYFHKQQLKDQADASFPIKYKKMDFNQPTAGAKAFMRVAQEVRPDFHFSLHNAMIGGGYYFLSHDIGKNQCQQLHQLLKDHNMSPQLKYVLDIEEYGDAVFKLPNIGEWYDRLEPLVDDPSEIINGGGTSADYLRDIDIDTITFISELPYMIYSDKEQGEVTTDNLRQLMLRVDANSKFLKSVILEEWERVASDLNQKSPFYKKVLPYIVHGKKNLQECLPEFPIHTIRSILFDASLNRLALKSEKFMYCVRGPYAVLCHNYEFVRLLHDSEQTPEVKASIERLELLFDTALDEIIEHIAPSDLNILSVNTLVKVQLSSGLIVLNAILENKLKDGPQ